MTVRLGPIGSATPDTALPQSRIAEIACAIGGHSGRGRAVRSLYERAGVSSRGSVLATAEGRLPFFEGEPFARSTGQRIERFTDLALPLATRACRDALGGSHSGAITHLVTASCTGFEAPGVDLALISTLGLDASVRRTNVGFMGCHAAVNALAVAQAFAAADPNARVLVCCIELCSLHFGPGRARSSAAADALFADGSAACVVSQQLDAGPRIRSTRSIVLPDSEADMSWRIGDEGFEMRLSARVPDLLAAAVPPWIDRWLEQQEITRSDIAGWAIHPGGPRIVARLAESLGADQGSVDASLGVLSDHGNMSSPTVLFVLERLLRAGRRGPLVGMAFGPGLAGEAMLIDA